MMCAEKENMYPIQLVRALMALRGLSVEDMSMRLEVQRENIEAYLSGFKSAISIESADNMFRILGVDSTGLSTHKVHFFGFTLSRFKNKNVLLPLKTLMPLLGEHGAMVLNKERGITPVLIKSSNGHRLVLMVKTPSFTKISPQDLGLTPGSFEGSQTVEKITKYYYQLIFSRNIRPKYFDMILEGNFKAESIEMLRMIALEYDIPLSEIISTVIDRAEHKKVEQEVFVQSEKNKSNIFQFISGKNQKNDGEAVA